MAQGSAEPTTVASHVGQAGADAKAAIYSVELSVFEGPLDLLLHLVRRHELDILDIPISFVAEKYLEYLHLMRSLDLEIAGDYLVMAATLAWLKSRELLPQGPREGEQAGPDDEEGEDPREALIRRLVEYERFKSAAAELDALPISGRDVFARGADIDIPPLDPGLAPVTLFRLAEAYYRVLTRAKINKTHDVTIELVTVAQRMQQLTLMLDEQQELDFEGLFLKRTWHSEHELRTMLVVTLMSILELVKLGVARVQQVPETDAIRVYRLVVSDDARKLLESYDEEQSFGAPVEPIEPVDPVGPPRPTEAELDALEERTLLAEALAGLDGSEAPVAPADEIGALAEELDPGSLEPDALAPIDSLGDVADLGPDAVVAPAANDADEPATPSSDPAEPAPTQPSPADLEPAPTEPASSGSASSDLEAALAEPASLDLDLEAALAEPASLDLEAALVEPAPTERVLAEPTLAASTSQDHESTAVAADFADPSSTELDDARINTTDDEDIP